MPFETPKSRAIHFARHGQEFGAKDEYEYERMADTFMSLPLGANVYECTNLSGTFDRIRLDGSTRFFGVSFGILTVRTFHVRDAFSIAHRGGPAGFVAHKCAEVHS